MKSKKKVLYLITLLTISLLSSIVSTDIKINLDLIEKTQIPIKQSGFWDLTGNPIYIDDLATGVGAHNWTWAEAQPWCSGSGNWTDPYVIENVTINAQYSGNCIEIKNSDTYFIVRNCSLYNSGSSWENTGIKLDNVDSGKIINNDCSNNFHGIYLSSCNNNTLLGNTASNNNFYGIYLDFECVNNTLSGNIANYNYYGIYLSWYCDNNTLLGNTASNNYNYGISIESYCDNNTLSGNTANNNDYGISLYGGSNNRLSANSMNYCGISLYGSLVEMVSHSIDKTNLVNNKPVYYYANEMGLKSSNFTNAGQIILINCTNSIISGLNFSDGTTGIYLGYSNNNTLSGNSASNNGYTGIHLYNSDNNTISGNTANNNDYGIFLNWYCDNNTLLGNIANNNGYGINLESYCDNNSLSGNTANNKDYGIYLGWNCDNNTLSGNTASNNYFAGISLSGGSNNKLSMNSMNFCGISLYGSLVEMVSHSIDKTNLVNNKPVYDYANEIGLESSNFTNAGQIILINCTNSIISELNISEGSGIYLYYCVNNTLSGNIANNNQYGIYLWDSDNNTLSGNIACNNGDYGICLGWNCDNNTLSGNIANNNGNYGINLDFECVNNRILGNNVSYNNNLGISLSMDCDNNTLSGNTASNNNFYGIYLWGSDNNTLSGNTVNSNYRGIYLEYSNYNTLSGNTVNSNYKGINLDYSNYNTLSGNLLNFCGISLYGLLVEMASHSIDDTNLVNNKPVYYYVNETGLESSNFTNAGQIILINCNNSIISELNISDCTAGMFLGYSNNNTLSGNILSNSYYGIWLDSTSNYNLIFLNHFINNMIEAVDDGVNNKWDNGTIGNYWDYYYGVDANFDGIGDTPYIISGTAGSQDNFPIYRDDTAPVITINFPFFISIFGLNAPNYIISIDELDLDTIWYTLDGGETIYIITSLTGTFNQTAWEALSEGRITIRFYANDTYGNIGFKDVEVIIAIPEDLDEGPIISFGYYYMLFTFITILSLIILEKQKKK